MRKGRERKDKKRKRKRERQEGEKRKRMKHRTFRWRIITYWKQMKEYDRSNNAAPNTLMEDNTKMEKEKERKRERENVMKGKQVKRMKHRTLRCRIIRYWKERKE